MKNNLYTTRDFYLAAYLLSQNYPLAGHIKNNGLTEFQFEASEKLNDDIEKYYGFTATTNPITFSNAQRSLKSIIHKDTNEYTRYHSQSRKVN